jgi:hypothetical protein
MYPRVQQKAKHEVSDECVKKSILIVTSVEDLTNPLKAHFKTGFTKICPQNTIPDEMNSIQILQQGIAIF